MKPSILTPSTIILGCHVDSQCAAIVGSLRGEGGELTTNVIERTGSPWQAIAAALADAQVIGARHVVLLSNDAAIVAALSKPFPAPAGGERVRVWLGVRGDGRYVEGSLGDAAHWAVLRLLGWQWAGRFSVQQVAELPAAKVLHSTIENGHSHNFSHDITEAKP